MLNGALFKKFKSFELKSNDWPSYSGFHAGVVAEYRRLFNLNYRASKTVDCYAICPGFIMKCRNFRNLERINVLINIV